MAQYCALPRAISRPCSDRRPIRTRHPCQDHVRQRRRRVLRNASSCTVQPLNSQSLRLIGPNDAPQIARSTRAADLDRDTFDTKGLACVWLECGLQSLTRETVSAVRFVACDDQVTHFGWDTWQLAHRSLPNIAQRPVISQPPQ